MKYLFIGLLIVFIIVLLVVVGALVAWNNRKKIQDGIDQAAEVKKVFKGK